MSPTDPPLPHGAITALSVPGTDTQRAASWRHNVGGFIQAHPGWRISADATCYTARRTTAGRPHRPGTQSANPGRAGCPDRRAVMTGSDAQQRDRDLADLRHHWGSAYRISWQAGLFCAERRDNGARVRPATASELSAEIRIDYAAMPITRA